MFFPVFDVFLCFFEARAADTPHQDLKFKSCMPGQLLYYLHSRWHKDAKGVFAQKL